MELPLLVKFDLYSRMITVVITIEDLRSPSSYPLEFLEQQLSNYKHGQWNHDLKIGVLSCRSNLLPAQRTVIGTCPFHQTHVKWLLSLVDMVIHGTTEKSTCHINDWRSLSYTQLPHLRSRACKSDPVTDTFWLNSSSILPKFRSSTETPTSSPSIRFRRDAFPQIIVRIMVSRKDNLVSIIFYSPQVNIFCWSEWRGMGFSANFTRSFHGFFHFFLNLIHFLRSKSHFQGDTWLIFLLPLFDWSGARKQPRLKA